MKLKRIERQLWLNVEGLATISTRVNKYEAGDDDIIVTYRDGTQFCLTTVERGRVEKVLAELVENLNEEEDG